MKVTKKVLLWGFSSIFIFLALTGFAAEKAEMISTATVETAYPGLASSALSFAVLGDLPEGILLQSGDYVVNVETLNSELSKTPETVEEEMKKNQFFLLEQRLAERGLPRAPSEPSSAWLERAAMNVGAEAPKASLRDLLRLHYRHRFDPVGLAASERAALREQAQACLKALTS